MKRYVVILAASLLVSLLNGCSQQATIPTTPEQADATSASTVDGSKFLLTVDPGVANTVIEAREKSSDGDNVLIVGRIGGSQNPWIDGRAAFSIVDGSLKACSDIEGDNCPTPWDYCCETSKLPTATALVKVVDGSGDLVKTDARELLQIKELSTVIVQGKAKRDDAGNMTVLANMVYVKKK
ncbi:MAG: hypothetical protein CMJ81_14345 [Planctomycetaceae bacterium]|nr:hypothetical protein [Planctomycetaceae bacterium]MBP63136.1 hypothetical protein [Planctomycetaceae bacterium]